VTCLQYFHEYLKGVDGNDSRATKAHNRDRIIFVPNENGKLTALRRVGYNRDWSIIQLE
jgi:hypothetical protein